MNPLEHALHEQRRALDEAFADYDPAAAVQRLASRIVQERLAAELIRPTPPRAPSAGDAGVDETVRTRAAVELEHLCRLVVARLDTTALLSDFVDHRTPAGAVVFGCLLYLTGRTEPAAFWWRFGAGAEDAEAMRFLVLHHCVENDRYDAAWWTRRMPDADPPTRPASDDSDPAADTYVARVEPGIRGVEDPDYGEVCVPHAWLKSRVQAPVEHSPRPGQRASCPTPN
ncbi:hypothetical protein [Embleya sp. NPDC005971]|uniref:hypothetical protein n=1 Tax=unclassified Embleya TaxID=2699296 RepID=UPI0033F864BF